MATGRPVFLRYDYHQHMTYTGKRSPFFINLKLAANQDGKLLGMESDWIVDHGPYPSSYPSQPSYRAGTPPHIRGRGRTVCTNHCWGSAFRAYGSPQSEFASEVLMDELAEKIGLDPFDLRYRNILRPGDTMPHGQRPEVYSYEEMMDLLRPKYEEAKNKADAASDNIVRHGVGIALGMYGCGTDGPDPSEVLVELGPGGSVTVYNTWKIMAREPTPVLSAPPMKPCAPWMSRRKKSTLS